MGRLGLIVVFLVSLSSKPLSAQVIECPGFLPSSSIDKTRMAIQANQLLRRFIAILDLQDVEAIDENTIMALHAEHPEQLAIKLSYLALQCQIVVLDSKIVRADRRQAVRRVFLDYVLMPPGAKIDSLADYVNKIAAMDHDRALTPSVKAIEESLGLVPRRQWQKRWFPDDNAQESDRGQWSVIVSSPRYEDEGWAELRRHQVSWPDAYFELDGPFDLESPFYAVVAGRYLSLDHADDLLGIIRAKGMAEDAFRWKAPNKAERSSRATTVSAAKAYPFRPTPPRPTTNGQASPSLSQ